MPKVEQLSPNVKSGLGGTASQVAFNVVSKFPTIKGPVESETFIVCDTEAGFPHKSVAVQVLTKV